MQFQDLLPKQGSRFVSLIAAAGLVAAACSGSVNGTSQDNADDMGGDGGAGGGAPVG